MSREPPLGSRTLTAPAAGHQAAPRPASPSFGFFVLQTQPDLLGQIRPASRSDLVENKRGEVHESAQEGRSLALLLGSPVLGAPGAGTDTGHCSAASVGQALPL